MVQVSLSYKFLDYIVPEVSVRTSSMSTVCPCRHSYFSVVHVYCKEHWTSQCRGYIYSVCTSSVLASTERVCFSQLKLDSRSSSYWKVPVFASFSSDSKQHGDTRWWEMSTASCVPPHRPDLYVLHQSNFTDIYVSEQDIHKSIKMAHFCICIYHCTCT